MGFLALATRVPWKGSPLTGVSALLRFEHPLNNFLATYSEVWWVLKNV